MGMFHVAKALWGLRKREGLSKPQMFAYQTQKLRSLVLYAWQRSAFYREYYSSHGIREPDISDIAVGDLPLTDKELLMEHFDRVTTDPRLRKASLEGFLHTPMADQLRYLGRYIVVHTSGTSGNIGIFVHDRVGWSMYQAGYPARIMNTGQSLLHHNRGAGCVAVNGRYAGLAISRSQPKLLVTGLTLSVQDPVAHNVEALNNFQPTVLFGYSSAIAALAHEAHAGRLNISPRMVVTSAEKRTEEMFRDIEEAWPGRQVNFYASTECPLIAVQHGEGLYRICDDIVLLELLDDQHAPVEEGGTGSIVLTPLHNRVLPLIRYQMLDMAERGPNQEHDPFTTFTKIHGRVNDALPIVLDNGEPGTLSPIVLCGFATQGLKKAKFVLTAPDQIEVRYMSDHEIDMVVREAFRKVLKASGAANAMRLEVKRVYALPPDPQTGKFRITEIQT